jgi:hypothetical protein
MARVGDLISYITVFVVVGIMAVIGMYIIASVYAGIPAATTAGSAGAYINNSYTNSTYGISQVLSWLPIIGIVIAASVVLGLLLHDLFGGSKKS